mmetsp:Transcript_11046/g.28284  ORF Transcript_11046/g.28284 Transcript_11046/m.28284 type:complete len:319 (-) Transcript_11046:1480-2436(-)
MSRLMLDPACAMRAFECRQQSRGSVGGAGGQPTTSAATPHTCAHHTPEMAPLTGSGASGVHTAPRCTERPCSSSPPLHSPQPLVPHPLSSRATEVPCTSSSPCPALVYILLTPTPHTGQPAAQRAASDSPPLAIALRAMAALGKRRSPEPFSARSFLATSGGAARMHASTPSSRAWRPLSRYPSRRRGGAQLHLPAQPVCDRRARSALTLSLCSKAGGCDAIVSAWCMTSATSSLKAAFTLVARMALASRKSIWWSFANSRACSVSTAFRSVSSLLPISSFTTSSPEYRSTSLIHDARCSKDAGSVTSYTRMTPWAPR